MESFETVVKQIREIRSLNDVDEYFSSLYNLNSDLLKEHLSFCGIIPEYFTHDSSEEKKYSKFSEVIMCRVFDKLGAEVALIEERANRADLIIDFDDKRYVADTKCFRMSRSALNPKDYKINAMVKWMEKDEAAGGILIGSFFPQDRSRLWTEAVDNKILILSYAHIYHILHKGELEDYEELFEEMIDFSTLHNPNMTQYWNHIDSIIEDEIPDLKETKQLFRDKLNEIRVLSLNYWNGSLEAMKQALETTGNTTLKELVSKYKNYISLIESKGYNYY